jgi:hypothetical protein
MKPQRRERFLQQFLPFCSKSFSSRGVYHEAAHRQAAVTASPEATEKEEMATSRTTKRCELPARDDVTGNPQQ